MITATVTVTMLPPGRVAGALLRLPKFARRPQQLASALRIPSGPRADRTASSPATNLR